MQRFRDLCWYLIAPVLCLGVVLSLDLPFPLRVEPYQDGITALYADRPYVNAASNPALAGQRVIRVPRHLHFDVELELAAPARVLRLLGDENDDGAFADWEREESLRITVPGRSCTLTRAVARSFGPGRVLLAAGGPAAAAPILIASEGEIVARTMRSWNKFVTPSSGDPLDFVRLNQRKLGALGFAYAAWVALLRLARRVR